MPFLPGSYGIGGWTKNDKYVFINDRFDIWKVDPSGKIESRKILLKDLAVRMILDLEL